MVRGLRKCQPPWLIDKRLVPILDISGTGIQIWKGKRLVNSFEAAKVGNFF